MSRIANIHLLASLFFIYIFTPLVQSFGFNLESLQKSVKVAQGFTTALFDNSMMMSPVRPLECWADA